MSERKIKKYRRFLKRSKTRIKKEFIAEIKKMGFRDRLKIWFIILFG